jgi:3-oxoacyl-[acyl-carrier protein] reductase
MPVPAQRRVLVTGATFGIGRELALAFAANGDLVAACGRTTDALESLAREAPGVVPYTCDVTEPEQVRRMVDDIVRQSGGIDVLVNNVGRYGPVGPIEDTPIEEWWDALRTNLFSTFLVTRTVLPAMLATGAGKIINLSGGGAAAPLPRFSAYAASKAAIVRFTETIAEELKERNIKVNAIAPGFIPTRIHDATVAAGERAGEFYAKTLDLLGKGTNAAAMRRICELALFLSSPAADGITGRLISAQFDDWTELAKLLAEQPASSRATLRRIDAFKFFEAQ